MPKIVDEPADCFRERLLCDCGHEMQADNIMLPTDPPKYPHSCEKCGSSGVFSHVYPRIVFR